MSADPENTREHPLQHWIDPYGAVRSRMDVSGMLAPVECGVCHQRYDSADVTVLQRYMDCSVWQAPCCGVIADDRQYGHVSAITLNQDGTRRG